MHLWLLHCHHEITLAFDNLRCDPARLPACRQESEMQPSKLPQRRPWGEPGPSSQGACGKGPAALPRPLHWERARRHPMSAPGCIDAFRMSRIGNAYGRAIVWMSQRQRIHTPRQVSGTQRVLSHCSTDTTNDQTMTQDPTYSHPRGTALIMSELADRCLINDADDLQCGQASELSISFIFTHPETAAFHKASFSLERAVFDQSLLHRASGCNLGSSQIRYAMMPDAKRPADASISVAQPHCCAKLP